jgi:enterochelin esterase family protein
MLLVVGLTTRSDGPSAQVLIDRHRQEKASVWADGETATFFFRGEADRVSLTFHVGPTLLRRVPGSDVWYVRVERPDLAKAVFNFQLTPMRDGKPLPAVTQTWRGPQAPPAPEEAGTLRGKIAEHEIESKFLGEKRKLTVYLPPARYRTDALRVVYAADGQATAEFARVLEPLVVAGRVPPTMIVGVHHGGYMGGAAALKNYDRKKDLRAQEYIPWLNPDRFAQHEAFFCNEVRTWAERTFAASRRREERAVFGYSNGGHFAVQMGLRHPELYSRVLAFSVAGKRFPELPEGAERTPRFYLAAGTWEEPFHGITAELAEALNKNNVPVVFRSRVASHDPVLWREEFATAVLAAFGQK